MISRSWTAVLALAMPLLLGSAQLGAQADATAALQQQLAAQFKLTTTTADRTDIVTAGDVVQLHKPGMIMYAVDSPLPASNTYKNGKIGQGAGGFGNDFKIGVLSGQAGKSSTYARRTFVPEEKCWLTAIQVQKDAVVLQLYSDFYETTRYYGSLKIPFPIKGTIPPSGAMLAAVQEVLTVAAPAAQPAPAPEPAAPAPAPMLPAPAPEPAAPAPAPMPAIAPPPPPAPMPEIAPPPPPADTPTITLGQTRDQVIAALGPPDRAAKMGVREILFFKNMKVTFTNGKVSKVE